MLEFISENIGSILVLLLVVAVIGALLFGFIRNKKKGVSSCSCGCSDCPMGKSCQQEKK